MCVCGWGGGDWKQTGSSLELTLNDFLTSINTKTLTQ